MIALVTCYFQHNYGSQLQALATQMMMEKLGYEHETIKIDGLKPEINKAKYKYFMSKAFDSQIVKDKMSTVRKVIARKTNSEYASNLAKRDALFTNFANGEFRLSRLYTSKVELGNHAGEYEAFIVGSDQLWLPSNISADYYTLNFVPDGIGKIAYATSFGVSSLPKKQAEKAKHFLARFDNIFLREKSGQELVKKLTGEDVPLVCDPTMLFTSEEWSAKCNEAQLHDCTKDLANKKYILCYFLGNNPKHRSFAKKLSDITGYSIVQLPHLDEYVKSDEGFADYPLYEVDPLDFVKLISMAEYVLTDSFHCTVFSNLYGKQFFTFRRYSDDGKASTNSRLYSLLDTLGEVDRLLPDSANAEEYVSMKLNSKDVNERIDMLRTKSVELLKGALDKVCEKI